MSLFRSKKEKTYWIFAILVAFGIFLGLFANRPLQRILTSPSVQFVLFLSGFILTIAAILFHGIKLKPSKIEIAIWIILAAFTMMFFFRLGAPERSHMIEYALLTILVHKALILRVPTRSVLKNGLLAFLISSLTGILDETLQLFIPYRVFDSEDILFNILISFMAIGSSILLSYLSGKLKSQ
ncbi:MAG: VanZ family protein [Bacteroidia bacterium]|nr:VanZ family protein [Bacteroidia bacterium]